MLKSVYDPTAIEADAFARANHTGTQTAATISDFDTEVANNTAVAANTLKDTNATHTGEVTGSGALTVADNIIDEANLKLETGPTNDFVLTADDSKSGGMDWREAGGGVTSAMGVLTINTDGATVVTPGFEASSIEIFGVSSPGGSQKSVSNGYFDGTDNKCSYFYSDTGPANVDNTKCFILGNSSSFSFSGAISNITPTQFTITTTKVGSTPPQVSLMWKAIK